MRSPHAVLAMAILMVTTASAAQQSPEVLPNVVHHAEPTYPAIARAAHVEGDVLVQISTDGESVQEAKAESGPALLRPAAEENARTWKFVPHSPGTFQVTFRYKMLTGGVEVAFLESPDIVQVAAPPPEMSIDWAWAGLGRWKAKLISPHGQLSEAFNFYFSGPDDDWLKVDAEGPHGETAQEESGDKEGDFLAFRIKLAQPDGKPADSFFVGRILGDKIVGTFMDDSGVSGKWTAVRVAEPITKSSPASGKETTP